MIQHKLEDLEKFTTLEFAKNNNLWIDDFYSLGDKSLVGGHEHTLVLSFEKKFVYKSNNLINSRYLTQFQEKQMSIQPDFILQFAHYLRYEYKRTHGIENPIITVDSHVALNGRVSQPFIDKKINIAEIKDDFLPKKWILKFNK